MRTWSYVLVAVVLLAGVAGLAASADFAIGTAQALMVAMLIYIVFMALRAYVRTRAERASFKTKTAPDSRSHGPFPEQRA